MKKIETEVCIYDVILEVSGYYSPEEPEERYDNNMTGYPGSAAEFEIESIMLEGINIHELLSERVIELIIEEVLENQLNQ